MSAEQIPSEIVAHDTPSGFDSEIRSDPRLRRLAKLSYRLACAGPFAFLVMALLYPPTNERALPSLPVQALWWILCLSAPCGAALGALALLLFQRQSLGHRKLNVPYARAGLIIGIASSLSLVLGIPTLLYRRSDNHGGDGGWQYHCLTNVHQLGEGFAFYALDYDGYYPSAKSWNASISPYITDKENFHCPFASEENLPTYAMNRQLSDVLAQRVETPEKTILLFDSE